MAIKTSRTEEKARITIDQDKCNLCQLCVHICKDFSLVMEEGKLVFDKNPLFGCIGCGHCVAICPKECLTIEGREISSSDFIKIPEKETRTSYDALFNLMISRRSTRDFKDMEVEKEKIEKILEAATTSPMGIPPSDIRVLVLQGKEKVNEFAHDYVNYIKKIRWFFSPFMLILMRPFIGKENYTMFKQFLNPMMDFFLKTSDKGENWVLYSAPLAMYFYGTPYTDPADQFIPPTYAMLAAESLGLGTCMIGSIGPFITKGAKALKKKYGIYPKNQQGLFVIFGYPKYKFHRAIRRSFADVKFY